MGLGLNKGGLGVAKYFAKKGKEVLVTDLKSAEVLKPSVDALEGIANIQFRLGEHRLEDFEDAEIVIANPGVPVHGNEFVEHARKQGIPVHTEMSYFFVHKKCRVIGITGTRGKSTTTNLTYQILKAAGKNVVLGGNIGVSVMDLLEDAGKDKTVVLEISSFMLEWMREFKQSPEVGLITNIYPDHLKRHGTMEEYIDAKSTIIRFQDKSGIAVFNKADESYEYFKKVAKGKIVLFGSEAVAVDLDELHPLAGEHNRLNIAGAVALAKIEGVEQKHIKKAISEYKGLYGREMYVGNIAGVDVVNDTTSTMPEATIVALRRFRNRDVVLLTGGADKGLNFAELAEEIAKSSVKEMIVLDGSASDKLLAKLKQHDLKFPVHEKLPSLEKAVKKAFEVAEKGDLLLFSPGGTSFEMFNNEFERGRQFDKLVKQMSGK